MKGLRRKKEQAPATLFTWCEPVWATPTSRVHIREALDGRLFLGGGIPNVPLCGSESVIKGWDLPGEVTFERIRNTLGNQYGPTCRDCAEAWARRTEGVVVEDLHLSRLNLLQRDGQHGAGDRGE